MFTYLELAKQSYCQKRFRVPKEQESQSEWTYQVGPLLVISKVTHPINDLING